ncbi:MAG: glycosyl hydrolase [Bacteroidota bacterium]
MLANFSSYILRGLMLCASLGAFSLFAQTPASLNDKTFGAIEARHIGPAAMSGRIAALDAVESQPNILYIGAASGGVWKSINGGTTFKSVFDKHPQSVGAVTIDQSHPDTVWVGTGEPWTRNSTSQGKGVFKSTNAGRSWKPMGLEETERIAGIEIDPRDPNTVFVAAMGHLWDDHPDRGVYKTKDGGKTWEKVLYVNEKTGCASIAMHPQNPDVLFAAMWDFRRTPWSFRSGGPGSGLFRSTDGGKTWNKLQDGLPDGTLGRIAVAIPPVSPFTVFALVESKQSALYQLNESDSTGTVWEKLDDTPTMGERPFYFSLIVPDPVDSARIYKPGFRLNVSSNGGRNFGSPSITGGRYHGDLHALWINPKDNRHLYLGTDGGLYISYDKGNTWSMARNLPISQFYHVHADSETPYNVYGGLQDNGSWYGPSRAAGGISNSDWKNVGYGDGFTVLPHPKDGNQVYWAYQGGKVHIYYRNTGERRLVRPFAANANTNLRFNWDTPIYFGHGESPSLYVGAQFLYRSPDGGESWQRISPDLTTNDPEKLTQESSGGLTLDNSTAENHCTIVSIAESPFSVNNLWVGTDDGQLQHSTNGGKSWKNLTDRLPGLPENTWISFVEPSPTDPNTVWVTADGHRTGDKAPYVYTTQNGGKTWTRLGENQIDGNCYVIRQDPVQPNLLFVGTEFGLYVSVDGGKKWVRFNGNVPQVPVMDLLIHPQAQDLIIGTHGRGIMIVDDLTPIRALREEMLEKDLVILPSRPFLIRANEGIQKFPGDDEFVGANPPNSAYITYYLKKRPIFGKMEINIYDKNDVMVKTLSGTRRKGLNRVEWNIRRKAPRVPRSPSFSASAMFGPTVEPGTYRVELTKDGTTYTDSIEIQFDNNSPHDESDRKANHEAIVKAYNLLEELAFVEAQVRTLADQTASIEQQVTSEDLKSQLTSLNKRLEEKREQLVATKLGRITGQIRLRERLAEVYGALNNFQGAPSPAIMANLANIEQAIIDEQAFLNELIQGELLELNQMLKKRDMPPVNPISLEDFKSTGTR